MNTLNIIALILVILIILISLITILFKCHNEKLESIVKNLDTTEKECFDKLKNKYDFIIRLINIIEDKYKVESKIFEDVKKMKIDSIKSYKNEKILNKCYKEILQIKEDNKKTKEVRSFKDIINDYEDNELLIISLRTYYNKYVLEYNNLIKKFPYNIISKLKKYQLKTLLEGKELTTNFNNSLEV